VATRRWSTYAIAKVNFALSTDTWYHAAVTWDAADEHHAWINAANKADNLDSNGWGNFNNWVFSLGCYSSGTGLYDGDLAEFAVYDGVLTEDEVGALAAGHCPLAVRPDLLSSYYPLGGLLVPKASLLDRWGSSDLTAHGSPDAQDHPGGLIYPSGPRRVLVPSGATGGAIAGSSSLTFAATGLIGARGSLSGAASLAFAPAAAIGARGSLAGTAVVGFSPVGSLQALGTLAGAASLGFTPTGALQVVPCRIAGAVSFGFSPAGAIQGRAALAGTAQLAFVGAARPQAVGALAGAASLSLSAAGILRSQSDAVPPYFVDAGQVFHTGAEAGRSSIAGAVAGQVAT